MANSCSFGMKLPRVGAKIAEKRRYLMHFHWRFGVQDVEDCFADAAAGKIRVEAMHCIACMGWVHGDGERATEKCRPEEAACHLG